MKLYYKITLINALTRILIVAAFLIFTPSLIYKAAVGHTDDRLKNMKGQIVQKIDTKGIGEFLQEEDSTFADYTILKEKFISIEKVDSLGKDTFVTSQRDIESEILEFRILKHWFTYHNTKYLLEIGESIQYVRDLNSILREIALYLLIIFITVTVVIDLSFMQNLLNPLRKIESKLLATKHPEKFDFRHIHTTTTDFKYLDQTISEMMRKIQNAFHIEKEFIANVSHELLTPISILQTRLENMLEEGTLNEEAEQKIIESQRTLGRLKQIIRSLLLISQIENNQTPKEDSASVAELLKEVIDELEVRFPEKNISLEANLTDDYTLSPCNRSLLFTMFFNLINNAIKYNKQDGKIIVSTVRDRRQFEVRIQDTGKGIATENLQSIFYRFKKFNSAGEESYGLGLPMVKTIADFHGMEIKVDSILGQGSVFTVVIKTDE